MPLEKPKEANWLVAYASSLRFPYLFALTLFVFLVDLAIPDLIPLVDEILLGLGALLLGSRRKKRHPDQAENQPEAPPH